MMGFWTSLKSSALAVSGMIAAALLLAAPAQAEEMDDPSLLAFGAGYYDYADDFENNDAADFRLEYRHGPGWWGFLKPFGGLEVTSDGGVWGGVGIWLDVRLFDNFAIGGSFAPGLYHDGSGKDLGHAIEFRSQAEIAYIFNDQSRLALAVSHLSNAGLGDTNPGTEVLTLYYMMPIEF